MKKYIALYRVSTQRQGDSHLGLESQQQTVRGYVESVNGILIQEFEEIESGGNKDKISIGMDISIFSLIRKRPVLQQVISLAQIEKATLIVKESSRLTRYSLLMEYFINSGLDFICADSPSDNTFIIRLKTNLMEDELKKVSDRTIAALAAKSARGYKHKPPKQLTLEQIAMGRSVIQKNTRENENNRRASSLIKALRNANHTWKEITRELNKQGFKTSTGKVFHPIQVKRLHERVAIEQIT